VRSRRLSIGWVSSERRRDRIYRRRMIRIVIALLVVWLILSVLGFVIKGLLWLAVIGIVLFVITAIVGFIRRNAASRS
jgi:CHASE2 domain-containing sensor protein